MYLFHVLVDKALRKLRSCYSIYYMYLFHVLVDYQLP